MSIRPLPPRAALFLFAVCLTLTTAPTALGTDEPITAYSVQTTYPVISSTYDTPLGVQILAVVGVAVPEGIGGRGQVDPDPALVVGTGSILELPVRTVGAADQVDGIGNSLVQAPGAAVEHGSRTPRTQLKVAECPVGVGRYRQARQQC